jgi:hypothetical protein
MLLAIVDISVRAARPQVGHSSRRRQPSSVPPLAVTSRNSGVRTWPHRSTDSPRIDAGRPRATQLADATKVTLAVLVILVVAALVGARVLQVFGVSLEAFSIAGGGVLSWIGFSMLRGSEGQHPLKDGADGERSLTPLILFAASPGTITGVITLAVAHAKLSSSQSLWPRLSCGL